MERWRGRVALVTGASVGIGASICQELLKNGVKVVGCAREVDKIRSLSSSGDLHAIKCDLRNESEILSMFEWIRENMGRLDICINNAGFSTDCPLLSGSTEDWRAMLDVNVLALSICSREATKLMREKNIDDGQIINISSVAGHRVTGVLSVNFYSGTKFMVRALTEGLRMELRKLKSHIRVASISPGMVRTEFAYRMMADNPEAVDALYDSVESLQPEDMAALVISILRTPARVDVNDIIVRPVEQLN